MVSSIMMMLRPSKRYSIQVYISINKYLVKYSKAICQFIYYSLWLQLTRNIFIHDSIGNDKHVFKCSKESKQDTLYSYCENDSYTSFSGDIQCLVASITNPRDGNLTFERLIMWIAHGFTIGIDTESQFRCSATVWGLCVLVYLKELNF